MEKVLDLILDKKLFKPGSVVGVGCSGGSDSMALLHFLNANRERLDISILAINIIHGTREKDESDAWHVAEYCKEAGINFHKFRVEAGVMAKQKGMSVEDACRECRFGVFEGLKKRGIVDYIALAHHERDQAETILLHILRGSGLNGASGMDYVRDNFYIRPFLDTPKEEIMQYVYTHNIPYVEDETNFDTQFSRNLLRQKIMPELRKVWTNLDNGLANFGKTCREDDELIRGLMNFDAVLVGDGIIKIPLTYFVYSKSLVMRLLYDCINKLGVYSNIERKHLQLLCDLASSKENGAKLNLPENIDAYKEYDYLTLTRKKPNVNLNLDYDFKIGTVKFGDYGKLTVKRTKSREIPAGFLLIDLDKIPNGAVWRIRKEGDFIEKFGGGIRKLKAYFTDKKVPARIRDYLPVLAMGNEVLLVAGVDISAQIKADEDSKNLALVKYEMQNWE